MGKKKGGRAVPPGVGLAVGWRGGQGRAGFSNDKGQVGAWAKEFAVALGSAVGGAAAGTEAWGALQGADKESAGAGGDNSEVERKTRTTICGKGAAERGEE